MSALLVIRHGNPPAGERLAAAAGNSLRAQGFPAPRRSTVSTCTLLWHATPGIPSSEEQYQEPGAPGELIACVGTLFYRDRNGADALRELWRDFTLPNAFDWDSLWGNYLLAVAKAGQLWLLGDPVGMVRLYHTRDRTVWSSSWLACAATLSDPRIDRLGAIDYVLTGANHGERTPLEDVRIANPTQAIELTSLSSSALTSPERWTGGPRFTSMASAVDAAASVLTRRAVAISNAFDGRIRSALSGGFDSRLIVAALRAVGASPQLHVYGNALDPDVRIACSAAEAIRLPIEHIDKARLNREMPPASDPVHSEQSLFFDGLPTDGIFDRGADRLTRIRQSAEGGIALNGGGGEILRNFFYLHDRKFDVAEIFQTFYSNWPAAAIPSRSDRSAYRDYMIDAMEQSIGATGRLSRAQVELIYPLFRVRYWTSRNNSLAARCGHFLTPLVDPQMIRLSYQLPLEWKDYGRFEAALLNALDPVLAAVPLDYGFTPAAGPSLSYRLMMWAQHHRPPWLRARMADLKMISRGRAAARQVDIDPVKQGRSRTPTQAFGLVPARLLDEDQKIRALTIRFVLERLGVS